ncbi:MBL fold metallo-hydrolase [Deinococcus petrolearius]|uniref:MBL fold metallo-hydrolase n=1 Tax=Deinococcus petrolearius TaxID=1751295 RepID=A0ABW1DK27_9DEIO
MSRHQGRLPLKLRQVAPGVQALSLYANVYLLDTPQGRVLVDTGTLTHAPAFARLLREFRPDALLLSHSHLDHAGNAWLAARAGVLLLAHPLEHARLTGERHDLPYPAGRPALGALASRLHPWPRPGQVQAIGPGDALRGWEVVHLPGHTDGQLGLRRGGVLIAADAVLSSSGGAHLPREAYSWDHARAVQTLREMADLDLEVILPGHGGPLTPEQVRARAWRDGPGGGGA